MYENRYLFKTLVEKAKDEFDLEFISETVRSLHFYFANKPYTREFDADVDKELRACEIRFTEVKPFGFNALIQTCDECDLETEVDEPVFYRLVAVYHDFKIYLIMTDCPEPGMFVIGEDMNCQKYVPEK